MTAESGPLAPRLMVIGWPAFLAACVLEVLVFALVDPGDLAWSGRALGWSRQGVYSAAFFAFWGVALGACWLTALLRLGPADLDRTGSRPAAAGPSDGGHERG
jgi:hypothetical protein